MDSPRFVMDDSTTNDLDAGTERIDTAVLGNERRSSTSAIDPRTTPTVSTIGLGGGGAVDNSRLSDGSDQRCGFCDTRFVGQSVSCVTCALVFHPDQGCLGVSGEAISVLLADNDGAITYRCCQCRAGAVEGSESESREFSS